MAAPAEIDTFTPIASATVPVPGTQEQKEDPVTPDRTTAMEKQLIVALQKINRDLKKCPKKAKKKRKALKAKKAQINQLMDMVSYMANVQKQEKIQASQADPILDEHRQLIMDAIQLEDPDERFTKMYSIFSTIQSGAINFAVPFTMKPGDRTYFEQWRLQMLVLTNHKLLNPESSTYTVGDQEHQLPSDEMTIKQLTKMKKLFEKKLPVLDFSKIQEAQA